MRGATNWDWEGIKARAEMDELSAGARDLAWRRAFMAPLEFLYDQHNYNSCGLATNFSTSSLYPAHHCSFPLRFVISACATISPTGTHFTVELWSVITAALSGLACRALDFSPLSAS